MKTYRTRTSAFSTSGSLIYVVIVILALLFVSSAAFATNEHPPKKPDSYYNPSSSHSASTSGAAADAAAGANSSSSATGGTASSSSGPSSSGATASNDLAVNGGDDSTRILTIIPPAPVTLPAMPSAKDCIGSKGEARAIGWNFISRADTGQDVIERCVVILQIEALRKVCQYDSANKLQTQLLKDIYPSLELVPPTDRNLSTEECSKPPIEIVRYVPAPVVVPVSTPEPAPKKKVVPAAKPKKKVVVCKVGAVIESTGNCAAI